MMRKMAWGLFILAVFCLPLTSCGSGKEESGDLGNNRLGADDVTLQFYSETAYPLPGGYTIAGIARLDSCLLLAGNGAAGAALGFADYTLTDAGRVALSEAQITGKPCVFVGFPNGDGGFSYYANSGLGVAMAIPVQSRNKEGAWALIRDRLSSEHQMEKDAYGDYVCGLPAIDAVMRRRVEAELSKEDAARLYALMESIQYAETFSSRPLDTIIQEVGQAYLAGDKTLDEAAALIQSRARLWVAEQYG